MRYSREHKAQTREQVIKAAAAAIRSEGLDHVGVVALMNKVGLTHGGFYAHFASKDDLLVEAVDYMFRDNLAAYLLEDEKKAPKEALAMYVDVYLSTNHRDARDRGCPVPTLAGEVHRMPDRARAQFSAALNRTRRRVADLLKRSNVDNARERAESAMAEMVGAISLARATDDHVGRRILLAAKCSVRHKLGITS